MILIGLGANLASAAGPPTATLEAALARLDAEGVALERRSPLYRSAPIGPADQPWFVNAVAAIGSDLTPEDLLARLHAVEDRFGRRRAHRWGARSLDLDLLDYNGLVWPDISQWRKAAGSRSAPERLMLPHPHMHKRRFVLAPLSDIAPDWRHPVTGQPVSALLQSAEGRVMRVPDG